MEVTVGSRVVHRGHEDFKVIEIATRSGVEIVTFENELYKVSCLKSELVHRDSVEYTPAGTETRETATDVFCLPHRESR